MASDQWILILRSRCICDSNFAGDKLLFSIQIVTFSAEFKENCKICAIRGSPELFCGINVPLWCRKAFTFSSLAVFDEFPLLFAGLLLELLLVLLLLLLLFELCELSADRAKDRN